MGGASPRASPRAHRHERCLLLGVCALCLAALAALTTRLQVPWAIPARSWAFASDDPNWAPPDWAQLDKEGFLVVKGFVREGAARWGDAISDNFIDTFIAFPSTPFLAPDNAAVTDTRRALRAVLASAAASNRTLLEADELVDSCAPMDTSGAVLPGGRCGPLTSLYFVRGRPPLRALLRLRRKSDYSNFHVWHKDLAVAWTLGRGYPEHFVNLYMPVLKPHEDDANIQLIPYSAMPARLRPGPGSRLRPGEGNLSRSFVPDPDPGPGSGSYMEISGYAECDADDVVDRLPAALFERAYAEPQLSVGDLLVLRADVVHRAAPSRTGDFRVALSVRGRRGAREGMPIADGYVCGEERRRRAWDWIVRRPLQEMHQAAGCGDPGPREGAGPPPDVHCRVPWLHDGAVHPGAAPV